MAEASGVQVVIDEPDNGPKVDPVTGTIETPQDDGGVVVQLDAKRPKKDDDGAEEKFYRNLAEEMDPQRLTTYALELCDAIAADDKSRGTYLDILRRGLDYMGFELKEPRANAAGDTSAAVEGMAVVTNPLLGNACLKSWANAQAELLPSEGPVKVADDEGVESEAADDLADALERDMNHWFTVTAPEYYPDTSHMLLWGPIFGGSGFKKIYRCPMRRRPVSESVPTEDLIVSNTSKDLRACARITHKIEMRPSVMKRMKMLGAYRDTETVMQPSPEVNPVQQGVAAIQGTQPVPQRPEDQPYTIWETQCELDLEEYAPGKFKDAGIPIPYLVTIDKDSKDILALRRDWNEDDEECERKRMYVRYPYVPGPGFYGTGLLHMLGNASAAVTAIWREALDTGMFANFPAFLISKLGGRQNTSDFRVSAGTGVPIETGDKPINQIAMPLPYRDVTPGLLAMMKEITTQTQQFGGSAEAPTAEGIQNVPVGTMLAQIEQATKVMAAAHKGMHGAQALEIQMIVDLFREHPEDFWKSNKICEKGFWNEQKLLQALNDCNLVPRSDPNTPSHIHRVAKAVALVQLTMNPFLSPRLSAEEVLRRALNAMREDPNGLIVPTPAAPTGPDPNMVKAQAALITAQNQQSKTQVQAADIQQEGQMKAAQLGVEKDIATVDLAKEMVIHKDDAAHAAREQALGTVDAARTHGLAVAQHVHDKQMDLAEHALNVHQALNPPKPTDSGEK